MDPEWKAEWLVALRSGEYRQAIGQLRLNDSFCCLGVLCDLSAGNGVGRWWRNGSGGLVFYADDNHHPEIAHLPESFAERVGLRDTAFFSAQSHLITMNDGGLTFVEIANWIEENL